MRSETSPQLVLKPSRKGRFFIAHANSESCAGGSDDLFTAILDLGFG